ncbi:class I SAM-dependent methyltransferase [Luteimonas sp. RIT-PG2_3]
MSGQNFPDHFSSVAAAYAESRPEYPPSLFAWIGSRLQHRHLAWEAGCGSGQASRGLAVHVDRVHASDPSAAQIAQAHAPDNVHFIVETAEACSLGDASADLVFVAQALHWFDRDAFFGECERVLRPGGLLVACGYQDLVPPDVIDAPFDAFRAQIAPYWPEQRAWIDAAYAGFDWPFAAVAVPQFTMRAQWPLARLLGYLSSFSASQRCREITGVDAVAAHAEAIAAAWGPAETVRELHWPLFVHARSKPGGASSP